MTHLILCDAMLSTAPESAFGKVLLQQWAIYTIINAHRQSCQSSSLCCIQILIPGEIDELLYTMYMERRLIEPLFFVIILAGTTIVAFLMFKPFLYTLIFAGVLAYLTQGVYTRLLDRIHSPSWTALCMTLLVFLTLLVPFTGIGLRIAYEASGMYTYISQRSTQQAIAHEIAVIQDSLDRAIPGAQIDSTRITSQLSSLFGWMVGGLGSLAGGFANLLFNFVLLLLFYYYLVRDGYLIKERLKYISPLSNDREDQVLRKIGASLTATVRGSLLIAALQGLVAGAGFVLFGVPSPALWGTVAALAAFVPSVGTSLVLIPCVLYLAFTGHRGPAIGLTIWSATAVGLLDNMLGPKLMARGTHTHPLVMLLAIMGGIAFYGPLGVILGPITVSLLYALLDIYLSVVRTPLTALPKRTRAKKKT
jgi:predicted PurR-regulated permease PerM